MKNFLFQNKKKFIFAVVTAFLFSIILPIGLYFSVGGSKNTDAVEGLGFLYQFESIPFGIIISESAINATGPFEEFICDINLAGENRIQTQEEYNLEVDRLEMHRRENLKLFEDMSVGSDVDSAEIEQIKRDENKRYDVLMSTINKPGEEYLYCEWLNYSYGIEIVILASSAFVNIFVISLVLVFSIEKIVLWAKKIAI